MHDFPADEVGGGAAVPPGSPDRRSHQRPHAAVHDLLNQGVSLLECARLLGWALYTVKRYAGAGSAQERQRSPRYRQTLVDPIRDHLRRRRTEEPTIAARCLLTEIQEQGYTGSANLLVRYLNRPAPRPNVLRRRRGSGSPGS